MSEETTVKMCKKHHVPMLQYAKMYEGDDGMYCCVCSHIKASKQSIIETRKRAQQVLRNLRKEIKQVQTVMKNDLETLKGVIEFTESHAEDVYKREVENREKFTKEHPHLNTKVN